MIMTPINKLRKILKDYYIDDLPNLEKEIMKWVIKEVPKYLVDKASGGAYFKKPNDIICTKERDKKLKIKPWRI